MVRALRDEMAASAFVPDVAIGIKTGGAVMLDYFGSDWPAELMTCTLGRGSSGWKARIPGVRQMMGTLPYGLTDLLRRFEDARTGRSVGVIGPEAATRVRTELACIARRVRTRGASKVVIVDDAIDSGTTIAYVRDELRRILPSSVDIRTCVITQTCVESIIQPDYAIFRGALCRFHWSHDYRGAS